MTSKTLSLLLFLSLTVLIMQGCKDSAAPTAAAPAPSAQDPQSLLDKYNQPFPGIPQDELNFKGLKEETRVAYETGMRAYRKGNWQIAFNRFFRINPKTDLVMLYEANCQLQLNAYGKANEILSTLLQVTRGATKMNAEWYMAIAELGLGQNKSALTRLSSINSNPSHPFHSQGKALLEEMR